MICCGSHAVYSPGLCLAVKQTVHLSPTSVYLKANQLARGLSLYFSPGCWASVDLALAYHERSLGLLVGRLCLSQMSRVEKLRKYLAAGNRR